MIKKVVIILMVLTAQPLVAGVYKWVDENGHVQYGERPPAAKEATKMRIEKAPVSGPSAQERLDQVRHERKSSTEDWYKRKEEAAKQKEEEAKDKQIQEKNCKMAKSRYNLYQTGGRIFNVDENGERHYVNDKNRESNQQAAKAEVDKWCR